MNNDLRYLANIAINKVEECYGCLTGNFVTDNAANPMKMRNGLRMTRKLHFSVRMKKNLSIQQSKAFTEIHLLVHKLFALVSSLMRHTD